MNKGHRIKEFRDRKQLTQGQLGKLTGIDQSAISRIERGERDIQLSQLISIAKAMEVKPSALVRDNP